MRLPLSRFHRVALLVCALLVCAAAVGGCSDEPGSAARTAAGPASLAATSAQRTVAPPAPTGRAGAKGAKRNPPAPHVPARHAAQPPAHHRRDPKLYPNARLTPGDVLRVTAAQVSVPGYSARLRNVPASEKRSVYAEYHLAYPQQAGAYECDHFIPLCLGGSNSVANLWPEPAPQFHWKDGFELYLWYEVRANRISLRNAQREMRTDWYAYWVRAGKPGSRVDADSWAARSVPAPKGTSTKGLVVGWSVSGVRYHYRWCRYYARIRRANLRRGSVAQARAAGKTPCRVCRPPG
jgi:hypothetical protein